MIALNEFTLTKTNDTGNKATFEVGPLPQGYGHTMGNFIRRVLLTSIPGTAITSVKIDGVQHEYATLQGVGDDILTILLSLKNVVLVSKTHDPVVLKLSAKGKANDVVEVKAADFEKNSDVEVINPDYVITTLSGTKSSVDLEITVERGVGYHFGNEGVRKELGMLPIDANYSPVVNVNYEIVPTRVGQQTDLDQVNITIETNGAVTPIEAFHTASDIVHEMTTHLIKNTEQMLSGNEVTVTLGKKQEEKVETEEVVEPITVIDLNLSTRLTNALLRSGYDDLRKLEGMTEEAAANIRGMGDKSFNELLDVLKKHEVELK